MIFLYLNTPGHGPEKDGMLSDVGSLMCGDGDDDDDGTEHVCGIRM